MLSEGRWHQRWVTATLLKSFLHLWRDGESQRGKQPQNNLSQYAKARLALSHGEEKQIVVLATVKRAEREMQSRATEVY